MSRTLPAQRLRELENAGIVERLSKPAGRGFEYQRSRAGEKLRPIIMQLGEWGLRWVYTHVSKDDLDPSLLMWDMHRRLHAEALPEKPVVVQFEFSGLPRGARGMKRRWLVLERPEVELCRKHPSHEVDLLVCADLLAMSRVWTGEIQRRDAMRQGLVALQGPRSLAQAFPGWLKLGMFVQRPAS